MGTGSASETTPTPSAASAHAAQTAGETVSPLRYEPTGTRTLIVARRNPARVDVVCSRPYACAAVPTQFKTPSSTPARRSDGAAVSATSAAIGASSASSAVASPPAPPSSSSSSRAARSRDSAPANGARLMSVRTADSCAGDGGAALS
eukprot:13519-Pelagococcus_subviridis.AAC.2